MVNEKLISKRQLHLVTISSVFGDFGSSIFSFGLSFMLLHKTGSIFSFALSSIISPIVGICLLPFIGTIIDLYSRKRIILISQAISMIALVLYFITLEFFNEIFISTVLLIVVLRTSDQFTSTARISSTSRLVLPEDLQTLSAYSQISSSLSTVISAMFGALLYSTLPFYLFLFIELFAETITAITVARLDFNFYSDLDNTSITQESRDFKLLFKEGLQYITKQKYLLFGIVMALVINFFNGIFSVGLPKLILTDFNFSNFFYSIIESATGIGMIVGSFILKKKNINFPLYLTFRMSLIIGFLISLIGICSIGFVTQFTILQISFFILIFLTGASYAFLNIPYSVWLQKNISPKYQGRGFSTINMLGLGVSPIGVFLFGILFENDIPTAYIFIISGIILITLILIIAVISKLNLKKAKIN